MKFIKNHRNITAIITLAAFCWLTQVATVPLRAESATAPNRQEVSKDEQSPGAIETAGSSRYYQRKKSSPLIPILIGVVVVGAVAAVLILVVFKSKYDIRGTWTVTYTWQGESPGNYQIVFSGSRDSGTFLYTEPPYDSAIGTYTADSKNVTWTFTAYGTIYTGTFTSKDTMSGTMNSPGSWTAMRIASAAATAAPTLRPGMNGAGQHP